MKNILIAACLLTFSAPAFAQDVLCTNNQNGDYVISLVVENGQVKSALFSNVDHGTIDDRALSSGDFDYQGATLVYGNDIYSCN